MSTEIIKEYVQLIIESRIREADVTGGEKVPFGSEQHIADLQKRILDLKLWRDKQRRGSEARANYSRIISRLNAELRSAKKSQGDSSK